MSANVTVLPDEALGGVEREYTEVERKACVGERIKIVAADDTFGKYNNGDVFVVDRDPGHGVEVDAVRYEDGNDTGFIDHDEYVVLVPTVDITALSRKVDAQQAQIDGLTDAVAKLTLQIKVARETPKSLPELSGRAAVIERAMADLNDLINANKGREVAEFVVNRKKRTVVAILRWKLDNSILARGIAKAAPGECFSVHLGKVIALRRAWGLEVPAEYTNAPQPTQPRVGDIVRYINSESEYRILRMGAGNFGAYSFHFASDIGDFPFKSANYEVVDDSREVAE